MVKAKEEKHVDRTNRWNCAKEGLEETSRRRDNRRNMEDEKTETGLGEV